MFVENQKQETTFQSISGILLASPSPNSTRILFYGLWLLMAMTLGA